MASGRHGSSALRGADCLRFVGCRSAVSSWLANCFFFSLPRAPVRCGKTKSVTRPAVKTVACASSPARGFRVAVRLGSRGCGAKSLRGHAATTCAKTEAPARTQAAASPAHAVKGFAERCVIKSPAPVTTTLAKTVARAPRMEPPSHANVPLGSPENGAKAVPPRCQGSMPDLKTPTVSHRRG